MGKGTAVTPGKPVTLPAHDPNQKNPAGNTIQAPGTNVPGHEWQMECGHNTHHTSKDKRTLLQKAKNDKPFIQLVPTIDEKNAKDTVRVLLLDPKDKLAVQILKGSASLPGPLPVKKPNSGKYTVNEIEVDYYGDRTGSGEKAETVISEHYFPFPNFWETSNHITRLQASTGIETFNIEAFNPHKYKFVVKLPAWKKKSVGVKKGAVLKADRPKDGNISTTGKKTEHTNSSAQWHPSKLFSGNSVSSDSHSDSDTRHANKSGLPVPESLLHNRTSEDKREDKGMMKSDTLAFYVDGEKAKISLLTLLGAILELKKHIDEIVEALKCIKIEVGFYFDFDLQLFQGTLGIEWYWKEHTDQRVFRYLDVYLDLTIINVKIEVGFGFNLFTVLAQVYFSLEGELKVKFEGCRDSPEGMISDFKIPLEATITGTLGARAQASEHLKVEAKAETALKFTGDVSVYSSKPNPVFFHSDIAWTGITCKATASVSLCGIAGEHEWGPQEMIRGRWLGAFDWPKPVDYHPEKLDKDKITDILKEVLKTGKFVKNKAPILKDDKWTVEEIAEKLAEEIDKDQTIERGHKAIEGLGYQIRDDFDEKFGGMMYASVLPAYCSGMLQQHLKAMPDPALAMVKAASAKP